FLFCAIVAGKRLVNLAGLVDGDLDRVLVDDDLAGVAEDRVATRRDKHALGVGVECAGAGVELFTISTLDAEPAAARQGNVVGAAGLVQRALGVDAAYGGQLYAEADMGAFR